MHREAPAAEKVPASHVSEHVDARPVEFEKVPETQRSHAVAPVEAWYSPLSHKEQNSDSLLE